MPRPWRSAALAVALLAGGVAAAAPPAGLLPALEPGRDGRLALQRGVPMLILFSLPDCPYCETVRRNYLAPLAREGNIRERPLVRETDMASAAPLRGFRQEASSGKALAVHYGVRVAPSVAIVDGRGRLLAPVLEGGDVSGMYGAYLDNALAAARSALAGAAAQTSKGSRQ